MKQLFNYLQNNDGVLHFLFTYLIASAIALIGYHHTGFITAAIIGLLKEIWDEKYGSGWSWKDIAWDAGALVLVYLLAK